MSGARYEPTERDWLGNRKEPTTIVTVRLTDGDLRELEKVRQLLDNQRPSRYLPATTRSEALRWLIRHHGPLL